MKKRVKDPFTLLNTTKGSPPRLPFRAMKEAVLGTRYELSAVIIGDARSRALNKRWRKKDAPANVLSFPLDETHGELFLDLSQARRDAANFDMTVRAFVGYLFIHGMLHLKGYQHGRTMESKEHAVLRRFLA